MGNDHCRASSLRRAYGTIGSDSAVLSGFAGDQRLRHAATVLLLVISLICSQIC